MRRCPFPAASLFILGIALLLGGGCDSANNQAGPAGADHEHGDHDHGDHDHGDHAHDGHDHGHDHDHPAHGPRDGELIELGDEQYHAEWIADEEAGTVHLYIIDGAAERDVPIDADELTVNVTVDGEQQSYQLAAVREEGEATTAHFRGQNKALVSLLKLAGKGTVATLTVPIEGQTLEGEFVAHEHAHGHDHDH